MRKAVNYKNIGIYYFCICFLFSAWCVQSGSERIDKINIPHLVINFPPIWLPFFLGVGILSYFIIDGKLKCDKLAILLLIRVILPLIPCIYTGEQKDFFGNYAITILCIIVYLIAYNNIEDYEKIHNVLFMIFVLVIAQTLFESLLGTYSYFDDTYYYKNDLTIPIGSSNLIGAIIIPCYAYLFCTSKNKKKKMILTLLMLFAVGLTKSRSSVLVSVFILALGVAWNGRMTIKRTILFTLLLFALVIVLFYFTMGSHLGGLVFYNNLSTVFGRGHLIQDGINLFWRYPLTGGGFSEEVVVGNPHNIVIFTMMRAGLLGIILLIIMVFAILNRFRFYFDDSIIKGCFCFMLCMFLQSMAEIVLYSYLCDFMFWFVCGIASGHIYRLNAYENLQI